MTSPLPLPGSHFDEINLKQVRTFSSRFYNTEISSANLLFPLLSHNSQDSPDNSMFSFQIGMTAPEEEEASSVESAALPEDVKVKLQEILQLLNQDISQLVQDAEPIRIILKSLKDRLPEPNKEALIPVAFIESRQVQVLRAQKRLADRLQQEQAIKRRDDLKSLVDSTQAKIDSLTQSKAELEKIESSLEARR